MKKLFLILFMLLPITASAYTTKIGSIYYNIVGEEAIVTYRYSEASNNKSVYSGDIAIPSKVSYGGKEYPVTSIGEKAFYYCSALTSVSIPGSVTTIGEEAFEGCSGLTSFIVPNSITMVGKFAFNGCKNLTSVTLGKSLISIGDYAFIGCSGLNSIIVDMQNPKYDSRDNCNAIIETLSNTLVAGCMNTVIPNSVTSIGFSAFSGQSNLKSIIIPESVTSIGNGAFSECCSLTSVLIPNSVISINEYAFSSCKSLISITIGNSVTSIGNGAFRYCNKLSSVIIGNSVSSIGEEAFACCESLTSITIPESVKSIGKYAFNRCYELISVTIESSLVSIGDYAFCICNNLASVTNLSVKPQKIGEIFSTYGILHVLPGYGDAYRETEYWKNFTIIEDAKLPSSEIGIYDGVNFENMLERKLKSITYTRTFTNTNWQAIYVPFCMSYADWSKDFEVARINDAHQWDDDDDGTIDRTQLEVIKIKSGWTKPNTPYLIRAKEAGEKVITVKDATLYKTEENTFDVTSWNTKFSFTGTYKTISGTDMKANGYYAMSNGKLVQAASTSSDLKPFRWYLDVTDRDGNKKNVNEVKIYVFGDDEDFETDVDLATENGKKDENVFDLSGRKVINAKAGIYVKNGKKYVVK